MKSLPAPVSGLGLLAMLVLAAMPLWLAALLAVGVYAGLRMFLPAAPTSQEIVHAGGVTEVERQALLRDCRSHVRSLRGMARQIEPAQPAFAASVQQFEQLSGAILARIEQEPDAAPLRGRLAAISE